MKKDIVDISHLWTKLVIITGVIVGYLALTSAPMPSYICDQHEQKAQSTDKEDDDKRETHELKASDAINSTAQISLSHEYLLLETLPSFVEEGDEAVPAEACVNLASTKVLKILFRRIIAPNAP